MITRRKSRELALQMLYQWDIGKTMPEEVDETFWTMREEDQGQYPFAQQLFKAATADSARIDQLITRHSEHWRLERMPAVDRNVLRLAIAEFLTEPETPKVVVINEALEIVRRFSGPESVHFVNGILDHIKKTLEKESTDATEKKPPGVKRTKKTPSR
jgi:N utilization substance protein B